MKFNRFFVIALFIACILTGKIPGTTKVMAHNGVEHTDFALSGTESALVVPAAVEAEPTEYTLPYPGILPDHPLYVFKKFRDRIMEMLIADPVRKVEFYILQSDKSVSSVIFLVSQKKYALALQTLHDSKNAKAQTVNALTAMHAEGKEVPAYILERLKNSFLKQFEILQDFEQKGDADQKTGAIAIRDSLKKLQNSLESVKK